MSKHTGRFYGHQVPLRDLCTKSPYTSKYNPIEHRLFPHVTRACQGGVFRSVELVQELMSKATTKTGLEVDVTILDRMYETGRKVAANFKEQMRVILDDKLPQWNYWIPPDNLPTGEIISFLILNQTTRDSDTRHLEYAGTRACALTSVCQCRMDQFSAKNPLTLYRNPSWAACPGHALLRHALLCAAASEQRAVAAAG